MYSLVEYLNSKGYFMLVTSVYKYRVPSKITTRYIGSKGTKRIGIKNLFLYLHFYLYFLNIYFDLYPLITRAHTHTR